MNRVIRQGVKTKVLMLSATPVLPTMNVDEEEGQEEDADRKENRYQRLMNRVIRQGVKTKVLMLSATPVLPTMPRKSISTKSSSSYWIGRTMRLSRISK